MDEESRRKEEDSRRKEEEIRNRVMINYKKR